MDDGQFVRIARVNSSDERVNGVIEKFLIKPPHHKLPDAFLHAITTRRDERLAQHGELGFESEQV